MTPQSHPVSVSVTSPISPALDTVKRVLFQPFDLGKWFVIGFCVWLAQLGEGGYGGNFNLPMGHGHGGGPDLRQALEQAKDFVVSNLYWILPLAIVLVVVGFAIGVLITWLNSRGRFMFLHCVALDKAEVAVPWRKFAREGNSLCLFRIVLGLIGLVPVLPLLAVAGLVILRMVNLGEPTVGGIVTLVGIVLALVVLALVFWVIGKLMMDFVVPIMFLHGGRCTEAWRKLLRLLSPNLGHFLLYLLFQIVLSLAIGALVLTVMVVTCCIFCCLTAIPFVGTVALLPVLVFQRSYSLYYLAQYGRDYDVFPAPPVPIPSVMPPLMSA